MRKSAQRVKCSGAIKSAELTQVVGTATLSVGNLLLSIAATTSETSATSNIDTALQLGPR